MKYSESVLSVLSVLGIVVIGAVLFIGGCDSSDTEGVVSPVQQIGERAEARWGALANGDFKSAYEFETPAYRGVNSYERFVGQFGSAVKWHGAKVKSIKLGDAEDTAQVNIAVEYTSLISAGDTYQDTRPVYEDWILVDGEWWFVRK